MRKSLSIISAVLFIGMLALWIRSYFVMDVIYREVYDHDVSIASEFGTLQLEIDNAHMFGALAHDKVYLGARQMLNLYRASVPFYGFGARIRRSTQLFYVTVPNYSGWQIFIPDWFLAALLMLVPLIYWRKYKIIRHRLLLQCCPHCGYDLRATKSRCPECGREQKGQGS